MNGGIAARRSIREGFSSAPVAPEAIEGIVACGLAAPSSKNAQPWRIHVVSDRTTLRELADAVRTAKNASRFVPSDPATGEPRPEWSSTVVESADVLASVSLGLFVECLGIFSGGRAAMASATSENRRSALVGYALEMVGIGAAIQSMWLAAHERGLGGVFMGDVLIAEAEIRARLGMTGDLMGVLALGHAPGGRPAPKTMAPGRVVYHG